MKTIQELTTFAKQYPGAALIQCNEVLEWHSRNIAKRCLKVSEWIKEA